MKRYAKGTIVTVLLLLGCSGYSFPQSMSPSEDAQQSRNQLRQLLDREAEIGLRLQELDYELKPENIERSFAGVGSTRPEELRETRRKKLQIEKDRLQGQLSEIAQDRSRLEAAILNAETRAAYASAMTNSAAPTQQRMSPLMGLLAGRNRNVATFVGAFILVGVVVALVRRRQSRKKR